MPTFKSLRKSRSCLTQSHKRSASCPTQRVLQAAPPTTPPPSPVIGAFPCMLSFDMSTSRATSGRTPPPPKYDRYPLAYDRNGEIIDPSMDPDVWSLSPSTTAQTASPPEDRFPPAKKSTTRLIMCCMGVVIFHALFISTPLFFFYGWFFKMLKGPASEFYREYAWQHDYPTAGVRPGFYWSIAAIVYSFLGPVLNHFISKALESDHNCEAPKLEDGIIGSRTPQNSSTQRARKGRESCGSIEGGAIRKILRLLNRLVKAIGYFINVAGLPLAGVVALFILVSCPAKLE